jgi:hypothetical protein
MGEIVCGKVFKAKMINGKKDIPRRYYFINTIYQ